MDWVDSFTFFPLQKLPFFTHLNLSQLSIFCQVCQVRIALSELSVYEATFGVLFCYLKIDRTRW